MALFSVRQRFPGGQLVVQHRQPGLGNLVLLRGALLQTLAQDGFRRADIENHERHAPFIRHGVQLIALAVLEKGGIDDDAVTRAQDRGGELGQMRVGAPAGVRGIYAAVDTGAAALSGRQPDASLYLACLERQV